MQGDTSLKTYSYTIVLEPAEEGGYTVTVPALPPVVTEGDTFEEAIEMAKDAIALYLRTLIEEGKPIPQEDSPAERTTVHVQVAVPAVV
ncbi:MAG: type II toxin-antitoxin system HicB family antitoxin [Candidatus Hydrogenedentes bacterium]|nr:type II toxin-antitoxin system HicB family antitoxin [Candidatus Hydrogenedentota bacterium]